MGITGGFAFLPIVVVADDTSFLGEHGGVNFEIFRDIFGENDVPLSDEAEFVITGAVKIDKIIGDPDIGIVGVKGEASGHNGGPAVESALDPEGVFRKNQGEVGGGVVAD